MMKRNDRELNIYCYETQQMHRLFSERLIKLECGGNNFTYQLKKCIYQIFLRLYSILYLFSLITLHLEMLILNCS